MELKLKVVDGKNAGQMVVVRDKFVIGRTQDCQLRPGSDLISRHHCALAVVDNVASVEDLKSRNGTLVNGEKIEGRRVLQAGDRLIVGPLSFEVVIDQGLASKKRPPVASIKAAAARAARDAAQAPLDVSKWLEPDPEQADSDKTSRTARFDETSVIRTPAAPAASPEATLDVPSDGAPPADKRPTFRPKPAADNSHDAASAMLAKLRKKS